MNISQEDYDRIMDPSLRDPVIEAARKATLARVKDMRGNGRLRRSDDAEEAVSPGWCWTPSRLDLPVKIVNRQHQLYAHSLGPSMGSYRCTCGWVGIMTGDGAPEVVQQQARQDLNSHILQATEKEPDLQEALRQEALVQDMRHQLAEMQRHPACPRCQGLLSDQTRGVWVCQTCKLK